MELQKSASEASLKTGQCWLTRYEFERLDQAMKRTGLSGYEFASKIGASEGMWRSWKRRTTDKARIAVDSHKLDRVRKLLDPAISPPATVSAATLVGRSIEQAALKRGIQDSNAWMHVCGGPGMGKSTMLLSLRSYLEELSSSVTLFFDAKTTGSFSDTCGELRRSLSHQADNSASLEAILEGLKTPHYVFFDHVDEWPPASFQIIQDWRELAPNVRIVTASFCQPKHGAPAIVQLPPISTTAPVGRAATRSLQQLEQPSPAAKILLGHLHQDWSSLGPSERKTALALAELSDGVPALLVSMAHRIAAKWPSKQTLAEPEELHQLAMESLLQSAAANEGASSIESAPSQHMGYAWQLLRSDQQLALAQLSIFRAAFTLADAQAVADLSVYASQQLNSRAHDLFPPAQPIHQLLASLTDLGLVFRAKDDGLPDSYRLRNDVRAHANQVMLDNDVALTPLGCEAATGKAAHAALVERYHIHRITWAERVGKEWVTKRSPAATQAIEMGLADAIVAADALLEAGDVGRAAALLVPFEAVVTHLSEPKALLELADRCLVQIGSRTVLSEEAHLRLMLLRIRAELRLDETAKLDPHIQELKDHLHGWLSRPASSTNQNAGLAGACWTVQAKVHTQRSRFADALETAEHAKAYLEDAQDQHALASLHHLQAQALLKAGRHSEAQELVELALQGLSKTGNTSQLAAVMLTQGNLLAALGSEEEAIKVYQRAENYCSENENWSGVINALSARANMDVRKSRYLDGIRSYVKGIRTAQQRGLTHDLARLQHNLAVVMSSRGKHQRVEVLLKLAMETFAELDDVSMLGKCHLALANSLRLQMRLDEAIEHYDEAEYLLDQAGYAAALALCQRHRAVAELLRENFEEARSMTLLSLERFEELGRKLDALRSRLFLAQIGVYHARALLNLPNASGDGASAPHPASDAHADQALALTKQAAQEADDVMKGFRALDHHQTNDALQTTVAAAIANAMLARLDARATTSRAEAHRLARLARRLERKLGIGRGSSSSADSTHATWLNEAEA